jgi:hypothetical protein
MKYCNVITTSPRFMAGVLRRQRKTRGSLAAGRCLRVASALWGLATLLWLAGPQDASSAIPSAAGLPVASVGEALAAGTPAAIVLLAQAQVDLKEALKSFIEFLSWVLIALGVCLVAYGAILIAQGRQLDGVVAIVAGFILVLAVPIVYYFAKIAGIPF